MKLPRHVHRVRSKRGQTYLYFQRGRETAAAAEEFRLPDDPESPEFWAAYSRLCSTLPPGAQDIADPTMAMKFDLFEDWLAKRDNVTEETKRKYKRGLEMARRGIGHMLAETVRPPHVQALLDQFDTTPGTANNILGVLRAVSKWGLKRDHWEHSFTEALSAHKAGTGHKPWSEEQCAAAERLLTGMVRRAYFFARYTGQRGSDVVRLTPAALDEGGFTITQQKTGLEVWCPIEPPLAAEMASWGPREVAPYLHQHWGKIYSRKLLTKQFHDQRAKIPELAGCTFHGLRATRVVELRRRGLSPLQIQDVVGMSIPMITRYCKFANRKLSGQAAVLLMMRKDRA